MKKEEDNPAEDNKRKDKPAEDNNIDILQLDREMPTTSYIAFPDEDIPLETRDSRFSSWSMSIAQSANDGVYGNIPKPSICSQIKSKILTILCCRCNQESSNNDNVPYISAPFTNPAFIHDSDRPGPSYHEVSTDEEDAPAPIVNRAYIEKFEVMSNNSENAMAGSFNEEDSFNREENSNIRPSNLEDENGEIQSGSIQALAGSFRNIPIIRQEELYINLPLTNHTSSEKSDIVPSDPDHEVKNEKEYLIRREGQEEGTQGVVNPAFINENEITSDNAEHTVNSGGEVNNEEISCSGVIS